MMDLIGDDPVIVHDIHSLCPSITNTDARIRYLIHFVMGDGTLLT
ncbi:hypothetical protein [Chitinophaga pinensis]|nr:hypothetical protein [Chitinophaga pinensis]